MYTIPALVRAILGTRFLSESDRLIVQDIIRRYGEGEWPIDKIGEEGGLPTWDGDPWPGGVGESYPEVDTFADLPTAAVYVNEVFLVIESSGIWLINRKERGLYRSNGTTWVRLGDYAELFRDDNFGIYDNDDPSKRISFNVEDISPDTTRTFAWPDESGTVALTSQLGGGSIIVEAPATKTSAGTKDTIAFDDNYMYRCKVTGTEGNAEWVRTAMASTWV